MNQQYNLKEINQVELAVRRIHGLELPGPALEKFLQGTGTLQYTPSELTELVKSEPAFVISLLKFSKNQNIALDKQGDIIRELIEQLGLRKIRNALLSERIYPAEQRDGGVLRAQMSLFAVACGCCCRKITEQLEEFEITPAKAYLGGLLSTMGDIALEQVVPKSFSRLVDNARTKNLELARLERENLGMDFTQAGKRVLGKFGVDDDIIMGVWLQRSSILEKAADAPEAKLARLLVLARYAAVKTQIADFEIYSPGELGGKIAESAGISENSLQEIADECSEEIKKRADSTGIYKLQKAGPDWRVFYEEVRRLSDSDTKLSEENSGLRKSASSLDFVRELISDSGSIDSVFDAAGKIAESWKKFYQTGKVCVYALTGTENIPAVLVGAANEKNEKLVSAGERKDIIPKQGETPEWLLRQLDTDFDRNSCRVVPLGSEEKAPGAVLFELRYPVDWEKNRKEFENGAFIAGKLLEAAMKVQSQQNLVEWILQSEQPSVPEKKEPQAQPEEEEKSAPEPATQVSASQQFNPGLEELAAGAAHELNNPLSVISGRAQLLLDGEQDEQKKQLLEKISDSAEQLSQIVAGLMSYAQPQHPKKFATGVQQIVDEAVQFAQQKVNMEDVALQVDTKGEQPEVNVDSGQIVSAVANIIVNSVESYSSGKGPVQITVQRKNRTTEIEIRDFGCGMDEPTLEKACYPFFSSKPAGRQRGMGLAYTKRLIEINAGTLEIESEPDQGTTVTVSLPTE